MRRRFFICGGLALATAACSGTAARRDVARIGWTRWHAGTDPYATPSADVAEVAWIVGDGLIGVRGGRAYPRLASEVPTASNGRISADRRRVRYTLRAGRWHDGRALSSSDVRDAWLRLVRAHATWHATPPYDNVADVRVVDASTFTVQLHRADSNFVRLFFAAYGALPVPLLRFSGGIPIGTGPFRMVDKHEDTLVFERVSREAAIQGIQLIDYDDSHSAAAALQAGEIDAAIPIDRTVARAHRFPMLRRHSGCVFVLANSDGRLRNASTRAAVLDAINVETIARKVYLSSPTDVLFEDVVPMPRSKAPLPHGSFRLAFARTPVLDSVANVMADQLAERGVMLELQSWPLHGFEQALIAGAFDLALFGGQFAVSDDAADLFACATRAPRGANYARVCDPALDRAFRSGDSSRIAARLSSDAVVRVVAPYDDIAVTSSRLRIPIRREDFTPWFADVAAWST